MKTTERTAWRITSAVVVVVALTVAAACSGGGDDPAGTEVKGVTYERPDASRGAEAPNALTSADNLDTAASTTAPPEPAPTTSTSPTTTTTTTTSTTEPPPAEPAIIEVRFAPAEGDDVTVSLEGTGLVLSLADGVAIFDGLADGTYRVIIEIVHPATDDGTVGVGSKEIIRTERITVVAGDHAVVSCADDCTVVL